MDLFVDMCYKYYLLMRNMPPTRAIVTTPLNGSPILIPEHMSLVRKFRQRGVETYIVDRRQYHVRGNKLYVGIGSKVWVPDIIVRRNTMFPKNLGQVVVNMSEVGIITGSKYRTYRIVRNYKKKMGGKDTFRLPKSYFARNLNEALSKAEEILENHDGVVIKPNKGEGGRDIVFIRKLSELEEKARNLRKRESSTFIVQEMINSYRLRLGREKYLFDIRVYAFLGNFIGCHIRLPKIPFGKGNIESWAISNISRGGRYLPVFFDNSISVVKWGSRRRPIPPFKKIIIDNHALCLDKKILSDLIYAMRLIVEALSQAVDIYKGG